MFIFLCTLFSSLHNPAAFVVEFYFSGSAGSIYQIYHQIWEEGVCLGRGRGVLEGIIGWGAISADTITQNLPLYSRVTACNTLRCIQVLAYGVGYPSYQCQCQCSIGSLQSRLIVLTLLPKTYHYTPGSLHAIRCAASTIIILLSRSKGPDISAWLTPPKGLPTRTFGSVHSMYCWSYVQISFFPDKNKQKQERQTFHI